MSKNTESQNLLNKIRKRKLLNANDKITTNNPQSTSKTLDEKNKTNEDWLTK